MVLGEDIKEIAKAVLVLFVHLSGLIPMEELMNGILKINNGKSGQTDIARCKFLWFNWILRVRNHT